MSDNNKQWFEKDNNKTSAGKPSSSRPSSSNKNRNRKKSRPSGGNPQNNPNANRLQGNRQGQNRPDHNRPDSGKPGSAPSANGIKSGSLPPKDPNARVDRNNINRKRSGKKRHDTHKEPSKIPAGKPAKIVEQKKRDTKPAASVKEVKKPDNNVTNKEVKASDKKSDQYIAKKNKRTKTRTLRQSILAAALCLLALTLLVFVVHHLADYIAVKPEFEFISKGSVEHTIGARALIVRDEEVIPSDTAGDLVTQVAEGSRVAKDQHIAMVVPSDMATVVDSLRNTQSQISEVQQELISSGATTGADAIYQNINGSIGPIIDMMRLDAMNGNISDMSSYASSISVLISQRETELSSLEFDDERLRVLRSDEQGYESQLERRATIVNATSPGIISFKLDGLETELSFDLLLQSESSVIRDYINSATGLITSDLDIALGENMARIASNEKQYLAMFLDDRMATVDSFSVGSLHTINIGSEGISIGKCAVERVEPTNRGLLVVFSTTRYVEDLLDLRTVDVEVVINETSGLRVPIGSLVDADYDRGIANIYVNNQGFADEIGVIILDYDREFAIIAPIGDNSRPNTQTVIITNPSSIKPGQKVD